MNARDPVAEATVNVCPNCATAEAGRDNYRQMLLTANATIRALTAERDAFRDKLYPPPCDGLRVETLEEKIRRVREERQDMQTERDSLRRENEELRGTKTGLTNALKLVRRCAHSMYPSEGKQRIYAVVKEALGDE